MKKNKLSKIILNQLQPHLDQCFADKAQWDMLLETLSISTRRHRRIVTEAALLGSVLHHGLCDDLVIVSDDAGQFNILFHGLCWVHTERLIHKLLPLNETHRKDIELIRDQIWTLYADLKAYKIEPCES